MNKEKQVEFYKQWIKVLDELNPEIRAKINSIFIVITNKYVGINGNKVDISTVEGDNYE